MSIRKDICTLRRWIRANAGRGVPAWRRARPALEELEYRLAPSVGGGWVSSTQSGQSGDGFLGQYFNNATLSGTSSFTRWDDRVDFSWTDGNADPGGSTDPAFASVGPDNWSAEWTGTLTANFSETYTFQINSAANGVLLWVAPVGQQFGSPIINDWTSHGLKTDTATMTLEGGQDYNVELEVSETTATVQQIQLQWSSPSTPLEDIEPATQVGLNLSGGDAVFANMVNGGTRDYWWVPGSGSLTVPTDTNFWPEADAEILLGEGDTTTEAGGDYLVQFNGMATVTDWPQTVDWVVNGTDLDSSTLDAGEGYNPTTNTTTATMVVPPNTNAGFYLSFTNTRRSAKSPLAITAIEDENAVVVVSVSSLAGIAVNQEVTIAGFTGSAAGYDGTYVITSVNTANNTFTYTAANYATGLPTNSGGGTALVNPENGITDLYVMQPTTLGGTTPSPVGTLFSPSSLNMAAQYSVLRVLDLDETTNNLTSNWPDRTVPSNPFWSSYTFNSGTGVDTGVAEADPGDGVPWEVLVALANETGKDIYINVPSNASLSYITDLAELFAYGSNGVTPYTSIQSDPVWKPLNPNLNVYIEFSNETWNFGDDEAETRSDGWANQLSQRALYDYLTNNQNDPLYPGGGSNAYNDGAELASYCGVNSTNDSSFLSTYNPDPGPSYDGASPEYFNNAGSINGYTIGQAWVGLRDVQISEAFKTAFGETTIDAAATDSRVRPLFEWQSGGEWSGALDFIEAVYGAEEPVSYYLYGGGGQFYADDTVGGFSDVSFTNPGFADGLTGWSSSGAAGVAANGSALGNPAAPPLFSAIAVTNGATETGDTVTITTSSPNYFAVGQSVNVAGVTVAGYNGTFTITSATSTTFTYEDATTGMANSGDGTVVSTGSSGKTAYLQPGASISQNVTFSGGYADITLYATQNVPGSLYYYDGLFVTLTPTNGGPAINSGQPIALSQGSDSSASFSGSEDDFVWDQSEAFYTGASDYTYNVTFSNTLPSGTVFLDSLAIQTVNGMFNETMPAVQGALNVSGEVEADVNLALEYGLREVGYEGGYDFNQNMSGGGYQQIGNAGYSSSTPNVAMYANLDPRTEPLAADTLDQYFAAGGSVGIVFQASGNINSWGVAAPTYFNWDTPKFEAAAAVEQTAEAPTYGLQPGQSGTSTSYWLTAGVSYDSPLAGTYLVPGGSYTLTVSFGATPGAPLGQIDPVEVIIDGQLIDTIKVDPAAGGTFTVNVGQLAVGQHVVELYDNAPASNAYLLLGAPGTGIYTLEYAPTSITWNAPSPIAYGTPLGSSQLDATANVPGTFTYNPAAGTILAPGLDTLSVTFTPTNTTDYATATATTTISVTSSSILFQDSFRASTPSAAWSFSGGTWQVNDGTLSQTSTAAADPTKAMITNQTYPSNVMITAEVEVDTWNPGGAARAGVGLDTNLSNGDGYNLLFEGNTDQVQFLDDGVAWGNSYAFNWQVGTWYWFQLEESNGVLNGKIWAAGTAEPQSWMFEQTGWTDRSGGAPALNGSSSVGNSSYGNATVSFKSVSVTTTSVQPDTASAGSALTATVGSPLTFSQATATGTGPLSYAWSFGDGGTEMGVLDPTYTYETPGTYTAELTVTDSLGIAATSTVSVTVTSTNPVLFQDTFTSNTPSPAWSFVNGTWQISDGALSQTSTAAADPTKAMITNQTYPSNVMITAEVEVDTWNPGGAARAGVGLDTNLSNGDGYNLLFEGNTDQVQFLDDGVAWGNSYAFNWQVGTWYWFQLEESNGVLNGKIWAAGTAEPQSWMFEQTGWTDRSGGAPALNGSSSVGNSSYGNATVSFKSVSVTTTSVQPDTASAGSALTATVGSPLTFSQATATGTGPLSYAWSFGDGGTEMGVLDPTYTYETPGTYTAELTVTDAFGIAATSTVSVTVTSTNPVLFQDTFTSNTPSSAWSFVSGTWQISDGALSQTSTAAADPTKAMITNQTYPSNVMITAEVEVDTWNPGGAARAGVGLDTNLSNGDGYNLLFEGNTDQVQFLDDGVAWGNSYAFNWQVGTWYWFQLEESNDVLNGKIWAAGTAEPQSWMFEQTGWTDRTGGALALNGSSSVGNSSYGNATVSFKSVSVTTTSVQPDTASAGSALTATAGSPLTFSQATATGTGPLSYAWSFGDGGTEMGVLDPTYTYETPGTYTAELTVTDSLGIAATSTVSVTVTNDTAASSSASADSATVNTGSLLASGQSTQSKGIAAHGDSSAISGNLVDAAISALDFDASDSQSVLPAGFASFTPSGSAKTLIGRRRPQ